MIGWLTPDYTPFVSVEVIEAGTFHDLVVDTGFNDYLYLPEDVIANWQLTFVITTSVELADGNSVSADLYEAQVVWFGTRVRVTVLAGPSGCDSLLGMRLLTGHRIELDEQHAEVRLAPL